MIQIIAICSLIVYLLELYLKPSTWVYLLLGILSFLIKLGLDVVLPAEDHPLLAGILLTHVGTFPVFPWLFLFFLGVFAYRTSISQNLGWAVISLAVYFILDFAGFFLDYRSKYDMSVGYFLLSCALLFAVFALTRKTMSVYRSFPNNLLLFLGQNSLLFLFVHFALIILLRGRWQLENSVRLFRLYPFLFWLFVLIATLIVMVICKYFSRFRWIEIQFNKIWVWILLTASVFIFPVVVLHEGLVRWAEIGFGITAGLYYHHLGVALTRDKSD